VATDVRTSHGESVEGEVMEDRRRNQRPWLTWVLVAVVGILLGVVVWLVVADNDSSDADLPPGLRPVPAAAEEEIDALIDEWMRVWRERDGDALAAITTEDFRYVRLSFPTSTLDGFSVDRAATHITRDSRSNPAGIPTERVIAERVGYYFVAQKFQADVNAPFEYLELYTFVDENGTLKFQFVDGWAPLGWHQTAEGQPYQVVADQGLGWPYGYYHED